MITLEKEFDSGVGGYAVNRRIFTQVQRNEKAAIYKRTVKATGKIEGYEVFRIMILPKGKQIYQKILEEDTEHYPSTNQFGKIAWAVSDLKRATELFDKITKDATPITEIALDDDDEEKIAPVSVTPTVGEYSTKELAEKNKWEYVNAYLFIKEGLEKGTIKFVREERRNVKGKPTKLYVNV